MTASNPRSSFFGLASPRGRPLPWDDGRTGFCAKDCSSSASLCASPTTCAAFGGNKVCKLSGSVAFGAVCDNNNLCQGDRFCLASGSKGFCSKECTTTADCPTSPSGATCMALTSSSACVFDCSAPGATCPTGLTCTLISGGTSLCLPPP